MMRVLGRLLLVPLAMGLAAVATAFVMVSLGLERFTQATHGDDVLARWTGIFDVVSGLKAVATLGTILPALLVVLVGEVARVRSSLYYVLGGGAALAVLPLLALTGQLGGDLSRIGIVWQVFATAGFAGGFVYWLVAGRSA